MIQWNKNKPKTNLVIDAIMLIVLMAVAGLGFLIKYVLLPGYKINELYGNNTELYFLKLDRHQWGSIHLYLAFFLIFLMVLHIILHWGTIVCIFRQMFTNKATRIVIAIFIGILSIILALAPLNVNPKVVPLARKYMRNRAPESIIDSSRENFQSIEGESKTPEKQLSPGQPKDAEEQIYVHHPQYEEIDINGTMTLTEISKNYNVSGNELARIINVPEQYANERLGRLRKRFGFELDDLRLYVAKAKQ